MTGRIAVVHNGIIENHGELRAALEAEGVEFASETDTEVVAHLVARTLRRGTWFTRGRRSGRLQRSSPAPSRWLSSTKTSPTSSSELDAIHPWCSVSARARCSSAAT